MSSHHQAEAAFSLPALVPLPARLVGDEAGDALVPGGVYPEADQKVHAAVDADDAGVADAAADEVRVRRSDQGGEVLRQDSEESWM